MPSTDGARGGRPRWLAWTAWCLLAAAMVTHLIPGLGFDSTGPAGPSQVFAIFVFVSFVLAFATVGALVAARRPGNLVGWLLLGTALAYTLGGLATSIAGPHAPPTSLVASVDLAGQPLYDAGLALGFLALLLFPTGSMPSRRWRWVAGLIIAGWLLFTFGQTFGPARLPNTGLPNPLAAPGQLGRLLAGLQNAQTLAVLGGILAGVSLIVRFRRADGVVRKQIEWLAYAAGIVLAGIIGNVVLQSQPQTAEINNYENGVITLALACVPVAMGLAILRRRLYDIDLIVSKTVVYALLALFITGVYVALVVGLGQVIGQRTGTDFGLSIVATVVVAVAFQPVRERAQRLANHLVYGQRATPYEALSRFTSQVAAALPAENLLPHLVAVLADATGAARTQIWLRTGGWLRLEAAHPAPAPAGLADRVAIALPPGGGLPAFPSATAAFEVRHGTDRLGALTLAKRPGEALTPVERRLAGQLAAQAGLVLHNAGLTEQLTERMAELRASRQRIVASADAERRRLERNIHDGAQQQLVALAVLTRLAEDAVDGDRDGARELVGQARADATEALANLRDLALGIYPAVLAADGLPAALAVQAAKAPLPVTVQANGLPRYPQDAEAAVYFCALEALQNVAKYAAASHAAVTVTGTGESLGFTVTDDGRGFDPAATGYGTGLQGMADRLAALGGTLEVRSRPGQGAAVTGWLPARAAEPVP
jgi:signal transduction histidine kinase